MKMLNRHKIPNKFDVQLKTTSRSGLTLVELVVSVALLAMIAAVFLGIFAQGFQTVVRSGDTTSALQAAQAAAEQLTAGAIPVTGAQLMITTAGVAPLTIQLPDGTIAINGRQIDVVAREKDREVPLTIFIPQ